MSAGIAPQFVKRFGDRDTLKAQQKRVGDVAILSNKQGRPFIHYLVTKAVSSDLPEFQNLMFSLIRMRYHMVAHQVTSLSIPRIGCGKDGFSWVAVRTLLELIFAHTNVRLRVYKP